MLKSHELLLKYRHDARYIFSKVIVWYLDRGAPDDRSCVEGDEILVLDAYYFEIVSAHGTKSIPYHRIRKIAYDGTTAWER
jgi:hypothetical protein